jgi:hypothetical protein
LDRWQGQTHPAKQLFLINSPSISKNQILGHQLINSRDAYSLPTDEELKEAYQKAYQYIKVYPEINEPTATLKTDKQPMSILTQPTITEEENYPVAEARNIAEVKQLLAKGYKYEMDFEGIKLFTKKIDG